MKNDKLNKLKKILGPDWTEAEIRDIAKRFPELPDSAEELLGLFNQIKQETLPQLPINFSKKVITQLTEAKKRSNSLGSWLTWPKLATGFGLSAAIICLVYWSPLFRPQHLKPGIEIITQAQRSSQQPSYQVRFVIHEPLAKQVTLTGDFTQWQPVRLKKDSKGFFWGELEIPSGTYAYGFFVDQQWSPDPKALSKIADGFGGLNSVINL